MHLKMSSAKEAASLPNLNVLTKYIVITYSLLKKKKAMGLIM